MKKNIILTSAVENKDYKGAISLENTQDQTLVTLKTFNLPKSNNKRVLGVLVDGDLYKTTLSGEESFLIDKAINLNNKISIVLLEIENNISNILIWGSNETSRVWQNSVTNSLIETERKFDNYDEDRKEKLYSQNFSINNEQKDIYTNNEDLIAKSFIEKVYLESKEDEYESDEYIENLIDLNMPAELKEISQEESVTENIQNNKSEFFMSVESQIEELLNTYEEEKALEEIIPSSKFVKVDLEKNGNFYVFGVIYENEQIKYIVYGLPGEYSVKPSDEYSKFYQWLPLNHDNPEGYGYYLMYQDASDGTQIEMIID